MKCGDFGKGLWDMKLYKCPQLAAAMATKWAHLGSCVCFDWLIYNCILLGPCLMVTVVVCNAVGFCNVTRKWNVLRYNSVVHLCVVDYTMGTLTDWSP